jgi:hypothetical protein
MSSIDLGTLPDDIREKLAELELELSEGKHWDISKVSSRNPQDLTAKFRMIHLEQKDNKELG